MKNNIKWAILFSAFIPYCLSMLFIEMGVGFIGWICWACWAAAIAGIMGESSNWKV